LRKDRRYEYGYLLKEMKYRIEFGDGVGVSRMKGLERGGRFESLNSNMSGIFEKCWI
jgi:hypothetical protein